MKLDEILALHPKYADGAMLREAIAKAEGIRTGLLTMDDKAILRAEEDAAKARLAADRIAALLPDMRADLHQAEGREALPRCGQRPKRPPRPLRRWGSGSETICRKSRR